MSGPTVGVVPVIGVQEPGAADVRALLGRHLALMRATSPPEDVSALDVDGLRDPRVTLYGLRDGGRRLLVHVVEAAGTRGHRRLMLETGTQDAFAPARRLYRSYGFVPCPPFADYRSSANSTFLALALT